MKWIRLTPEALSRAVFLTYPIFCVYFQVNTNPMISQVGYLQVVGTYLLFKFPCEWQIMSNSMHVHWSDAGG